MASRALILGLPVMLSSGFGIVINFSDKFFLEKYVSLSDLSTYYLGISCASIIPLIFTSFQNAWLPIFLKEKDLQRNIAKTRKMMLQLALVFLVISILVYLFVVTLFKLNVFAEKYSQTVYVLPILLISQIIAALVPLYTNYLVYFEKTHIASFTGIVICLLTIGLSLLLIPRYGVYGAATVSLTCNICYFVIYYFIIRMFKRSYLLMRI
jgi:O-antigen/teichoic acid export membrane protein